MTKTQKLQSLYLCGLCSQVAQVVIAGSVHGHWPKTPGFRSITLYDGVGYYP